MPKDRWTQRWIMASSVPKIPVYIWKSEKQMQRAATILPQMPAYSMVFDSLSRDFSFSCSSSVNAPSACPVGAAGVPFFSKSANIINS